MFGPWQIESNSFCRCLDAESQPMIEIEHLQKRYGSFMAVKDISFTVRSGEVLGFLGPNGAGKTTTMRMITGYLHPDGGTVRVFGNDVHTHSLKVKTLIGYLPEGAPAYGEMTVKSFLNFIAAIRGINAAEKPRRLESVIERLQLQSVMNRRIETLSKGFKRRVGLAQAIIHQPPALILDEPTDGLDPNQKHQVHELIRELAQNCLIIISTHILEEVHAVCTRAIIIAQGRIVADASPTELEQRSRYHGAVRLNLPDSGLAAELSILPGVAAVESDPLSPGRILLFPEPGYNLFPTIREWIYQRRVDVVELAVERGRLDEVFRRLTTEETDRCA